MEVSGYSVREQRERESKEREHRERESIEREREREREDRTSLLTAHEWPDLPLSVDALTMSVVYLLSPSSL